MHEATRQRLQAELDELRAAGSYKEERILCGPQGSRVRTRSGEFLNFCANNYLGLANDPRIVEAARSTLERWGYGLSSVRFICGTQELHEELERELASFLQMDDTILYSSCFDANGGLFEVLLDDRDAVISDALNHASIIDGIRLCKAQRFRYPHADMTELERILERTRDLRTRLIVTDGVFSMDGDVAPLGEICALAERHAALVMVDDSHATGFYGPNGRGSIEATGVLGRVDIVTSTFGKALGGASGGFTSARQEIVDLLRQRSRPYLFSNSLAPALVAAGLAALRIVREDTELRARLAANTRQFRTSMRERGFELLGGEHPIVPILLHDAQLALRMAQRLLEEGIYVVAFRFPVVPRDQARIRVQISAAHTAEEIERAADAFARVARELGAL